MFEIRAQKNNLCVHRRETLTSGSVNVYLVRFSFSHDWERLERTAVFRAGDVSVSVPLPDSGICVIPSEVLTDGGRQLSAGVYGTDGGETALPTIWTDLGFIQTGAVPGKSAELPDAEPWKQALAEKGDNLGYTETGELGLYSGEKLLSSVPLSGGSGPSYEFGHGLKVSGTKVSVEATGDFSGDNTLPMSATGVQTVVGNIEALLSTI